MYGNVTNENINGNNINNINLNDNKIVNNKDKNDDLYNKSSRVTNIFDDKEKKDKAFFDNVMKNTKTKKKNRKFSQNKRMSTNNQNNNDTNEYSYLNNNLYQNKINSHKIPLYINPKYEINTNKIQNKQRKNHFEELKDKENLFNKNDQNYKLNVNSIKSQSYQKKK